MIEVFAEAGRDEAAWIAGFKALSPRTVGAPHAMHMIAINDDECILRMTISDAARQAFGVLHGGVSLLLAESAASTHACWGLDLHKQVPVGIEVSGSHLASAREGWIEAVARVVRRGRKVVVHQVDIFHEDGRRLCTARVTNLIVSPPTKPA